MENKELQKINKPGIFSRIKNWFRGLFNKNENAEAELEFEKEEIVENDDIIDDNTQEDKLKYEFSTGVVSKQKLNKLKMDLDNGNVGISELYELTDEEIEELKNMYEAEILDSVTKLKELDFNLEGYKRKIEKIQAQN